MQRHDNFNVFEQRLTFLAHRIESRGGLNLLELHNHSETFYVQLLNLLYGWQLVNLNSVQQNAAGVDLIDTHNKLVVQVSATATKGKVESALGKDLSEYTTFTFKFVALARPAAALRQMTFLNPHGLVFSPSLDVLDVRSMCVQFQTLDIETQGKVVQLVRAEIPFEADSRRMESNLTAIVKILSKEDLTKVPQSYQTIPFSIDAKIKHNGLVVSTAIIDDYKIHSPRLGKIYETFDAQGANKSASILNKCRSIYTTALARCTESSTDQHFAHIVDCLVAAVRDSKNYEAMAEEELRMCVEILAVDAFIRCKIFAHPEVSADAGS